MSIERVEAERQPAASAVTTSEDTPQALQYSRIRRWISVADTATGIVFLIVLLATGLTRGLRDVAFRIANEHYVFALFFYVLLLMALNKIISIPLDVYGFRLEHRFQLSNQTNKAWIFDDPLKQLYITRCNMLLITPW